MDLKTAKENNICCFFGHRDTYSEEIISLKKEIEKLIDEYNVKTFYVGGYGNFDSYVTKTINNIKKNNINIKLYLITAYFSTLENKKDYITENYDGTIFPDGLECALQRYAIPKHNRWIVEQCQYMIAYVKYTWGGAYTAFQYAKRKKLKIINLAENKLYNFKSE